MKLQLGDIELHILSDGTFRLDGGAMFGVVPKVLWRKLVPCDRKNRIPMGLNVLLIRTRNELVLVDTGIGDKFNRKFEKIYAVERSGGLLHSLRQLGYAPEDIDIVVNTHLHFDHCGGNTVRKGDEVLATFPRAIYMIQRGEWEDALHPDSRSRASYLPENFLPLEEQGRLRLIDGDTPVAPGVRTCVTGGHTRYHQIVVVESRRKRAAFLGDLVPTRHHLRTPYVMGYDLYPVETMRRKKEILRQALREGWLLIFEHDSVTRAGYLTEKDGRLALEPPTG